MYSCVENETHLILSYLILSIDESSRTIKSKNVVIKKREREKTVNTGPEYQAACK